MASTTSDDEKTASFTTLDDKGRLPVHKELRDALGLRPGSAVAYVLLEGMRLVIPQGAQLALLTEQAAAALASADLTTEDLLSQLPDIRAEVMRETYGQQFMDALERERVRLNADHDR